MIPAIDHSGLSPSGRCSKRARKAWEAREFARLFPAGTFDPTPLTEAEQRAAKIKALLRHACDLRGLAARGMQTRKLTKEADRIEAEATALSAS